MQSREIERKEKRISYLKNKLKSQLSDVGDWKIIKIYEARMAGKEDPYDFEKLVAAREAIRAEINALQKEISGGEEG